MQKICYCAIIYLYLHTLSITQKYNTFNIFISQKYLQNHPQIGTLPLICRSLCKMYSLNEF